MLQRPREDLLALSPYEQLCRAVYRYQTAPTTENKQMLKDLRARFPDEPDPSDPRSQAQFLLEDSFFFPDGHPVAVIPHIRYAPPCLDSHSFYEVIYVCSGSCRQQMHAHTFSMEQGDLCILPPGQMHAIHCFDDNSIVLNMLIRRSSLQQSFQSLLYDFGALSSFFFHTLFNKDNGTYLFFHCGTDQTIHNLFESMYREFVQLQPFSASVLSGQLIQLLGLLMRGYQPDAVQVRTGKHHPSPQIPKILQYITDNWKTVTLQDVASAFGYSRSRCSNLIKESTGKTFSEIVREERTKHAAKLLMSDRLTIAQVAEQAGFCDASHLYRTFSAVYGDTPFQYRSKYRK